MDTETQYRPADAGPDYKPAAVVYTVGGDYVSCLVVTARSGHVPDTEEMLKQAEAWGCRSVHLYPKQRVFARVAGDTLRIRLETDWGGMGIASTHHDHYTGRFEVQ